MPEQHVREKIDVIIPAYNCHNTIERCLASIYEQTIINDITVTIADDCSDKDYEYLKLYWGTKLNLNIIRLKENGGPGLARQFGYDRSENPLVTFIDADDVYANPFALECLREGLYETRAYEYNVACWGTFYENLSWSQFVKHDPGSVWMFGKLYKRSFLDKHRIRFHPTSRYNEDTGFNLMCSLFANNDTECIVAKNDVVYYWMNGQRTITRKDGDAEDYGDNHGLVGYAENCTRSLLYLAGKKPSNNVRSKALEVEMMLYFYYCKAEVHEAYLLDLVRYRCAEFTQLVYNTYDGFTPTDKAIYFKAGVNNVPNFMPQYTFDDFVKMMTEYDLSQPVPEYKNERRNYEVMDKEKEDAEKEKCD